MTKKYKIHEAAKDFDIQSKDLIELVSKYFDGEKKYQTALEEKELDLVFDLLSKQNAPKSLDSYFARQKSAEDVKEKPQKSAAEPKKTASKADAGKTKQNAKTDNSAPFKSKKEKKEKDPSKPMQSRTKGEMRHVDTRGNSVDLDKYNERYENIAPVNNRNNGDNTVHKQKLKQKSQQYRRQKGVRSHKRETEAERLKRIAAERAKRHIKITIPDEITVGDLALKLKMTAAEVIKKLMALGIMATVNDVIDYDTVVVVMGHVDHGKTSLLDAIRNTSVTETEAGGITQHIGAYRVNLNGQMITFLDTPGHAAFTSMRARGAMATDIAVLVVAADDGIMPQTIEAINHAKAAGVSVIVAINKMDKPDASPDRVLQQLTEYDLVPEEWGGDVICVPVSAKTHMGIDKLLESILLVAEMLELKANPNRAAKGIVIEAKLDKGRGPVATLLVQNGTLRTGDIVVAGTTVGRVRVMTNERGKKLEEAGPSVPVEVMGLDEVPTGGDKFDAVSDEKLARELVEQRKHEQKEEQFKQFQKVTLDNLFSSINEGELKELNIIVKADVQGSVEAVRQSLEKLSNDEVKVKVIHGGVGAVSESDVMLAAASNAIIVGFNVRPDSVAESIAERDGVDMRMYRIIYDCIEEISDAIKGMLAPKYREVTLGKAEVRNVFKLSSAGMIAGSYVLDGKITRNSQIRVVRDGIVVSEDSIASLKRFKDDVKEVQSGYECGIGLEKFNDIKEGDILEAFVMEEYKD